MLIPSFASYVLDASIILKPFLAEDGYTEVVDLFQRSSKKEISLFVPSIMMYEVGNILARKFSGIALDKAISKLMSLNIMSLDVQYAGVNEILKLTRLHPGITFYDASYYALACEIDAKLITADKKFTEAINDPTRIIQFSA
jgi:predicted nucleic acid-binding protein